MGAMSECATCAPPRCFNGAACKWHTVGNCRFLHDTAQAKQDAQHQKHSEQAALMERLTLLEDMVAGMAAARLHEKQVLQDTIKDCCEAHMAGVTCSARGTGEDLRQQAHERRLNEKGARLHRLDASGGTSMLGSADLLEEELKQLKLQRQDDAKAIQRWESNLVYGQSKLAEQTAMLQALQDMCNGLKDGVRP